MDAKHISPSQYSLGPAVSSSSSASSSNDIASTPATTTVSLESIAPGAPVATSLRQRTTQLNGPVKDSIASSGSHDPTGSTSSAAGVEQSQGDHSTSAGSTNISRRGSRSRFAEVAERLATPLLGSSSKLEELKEQFREGVEEKYVVFSSCGPIGLTSDRAQVRSTTYSTASSTSNCSSSIMGSPPTHLLNHILATDVRRSVIHFLPYHV
jgi:hypothetical protein